MNKKSPVFPGVFVQSLHIIALFQLVIAWPVYDLLSRYPEFFVVRQATPYDVVFLVFALSLALPLLLAGLQIFSHRFHPKAGTASHGVIIFLLFLFLGHLSANEFDAIVYVDVWATMIALGLFFFYVKTQAGKLFLSFLTPAIVIVPMLFLLDGGIRPLLHPTQAVFEQSSLTSEARTPLLMVVFDELPSNALLDTDGLIDASRFPNFSAISKEAHWYPNATTVATSTVLAIPAILTGRYPVTYLMPHQGEYPNNLFTWLGDDYDLHVLEAVSAMCPANLCGSKRLPPAGKRWKAMMQDVSAIYLSLTMKQLLPDLPAINQSWEGFWGEAIQGGGMYEHRLQQMDAFLEKLQSTERPGLDFIHVNFPHIPYEYLPSGKRYNDGWLMPGLDFTTNTWVGDQAQSRQMLERLTMQVGAADAWLGRMISKLKHEDLYERSLIILTADHGVSFEPGSGRRDAPPASSLDANILPVPLIIKVPFQSQGHRDPRNAEVIDILPTVAEVLNRKLPWDVDGQSLLGEPGLSEKRAVYEFKNMTPYVTSLARVEAALDSAWVKQYWEAPFGHLTGKSLSQFIASSDPGMRVELDNADFFQDVNPEGDFLPAHVNGELIWPGHGAADLAIAMNGNIVTVSTAYDDKGKWKFSAMLSESDFRAGNNDLEVLGLIRLDERFELIRGSNSTGQASFTWDQESLTVRDSQGRLTPDTIGISGELDYISRGADSLEFFGWGFDTAQSRVLDVVLIFAGDRLVWQGETHMLREETHSFDVVVEVGFNAVIPLARIGEAATTDLRVFAVSEDRRVREILLKQD